MDFLESVFRFVVTLAVRDDEGVLRHVELRGPLGGGLMLGRVRDGHDPHWPIGPGTAGLYLEVTDPDDVLSRARAAGAGVVRETYDTDYGSREACVRDPDGNYWSFGTYAGALA